MINTIVNAKEKGNNYCYERLEKAWMTLKETNSKSVCSKCLSVGFNQVNPVTME